MSTTARTGPARAPDVPELPEVETVARLIRRPLVGRRIEGTHVAWERTLGGQPKRAFSRSVRGAHVAAVERRGKYVILVLERDGENAGRILVHLRMTGRLHVDPAGEPERDYTRVVCRLDDGAELRFVDVRKFGRFRFLRDPDEVLGELGPEPLEDGFDATWLRGALRARKRLLKPLLLDQTFLAGLGNIYVDEALHQARLHPLAPAHRVSAPKAAALAEAIRTTLAEAIEREGSSFDVFYRTPEGNPGSYQHQFQVYGRTGKPCRRCGTLVRRIVVGQRGTHLCPRCQPKPRG